MDTAPSPDTARTDGWIPDWAREATAVESLQADPESDPLCTTPPTLIDLGKTIVHIGERELRAATAVSDAEESGIADQIERELPKQPRMAGKWDRPSDLAKYGPYVRALVRNLSRFSTRSGIRFRPHLVHDSKFNAAALPGGVLIINTGLFDGPNAVKSEAELVAVLAHEIAHVDERHCIAAYQYARAVLGEDVGAGVLAMRALTMPLQSEHEHEADHSGSRIAIKAQYNPEAAVELWRSRSRARPSPDLDDVVDVLAGALGTPEDLLSSHPRPAERACRAMEQVLWAKKHSKHRRLYDGETNLQTRKPGPVQAY